MPQDYRSDVRRIYDIAGRLLDINSADFPDLHRKILPARVGVSGNDTRSSTTIPNPKILTVVLSHAYRLIGNAWAQQTAGVVYITWARRNNQDTSRPTDEDSAGKWKRIKIQDDEHSSRLAIQINWPFRSTIAEVDLEWDNWVVAYRVPLPTT